MLSKYPNENFTSDANGVKSSSLHSNQNNSLAMNNDAVQTAISATSINSNSTQPQQQQQIQHQQRSPAATTTTTISTVTTTIKYFVNT